MKTTESFDRKKITFDLQICLDRQQRMNDYTTPLKPLYDGVFQRMRSKST